MIKSHVLFTEAVVLLFASQSRWIGFEPMTFASLLRIAVKTPIRIYFYSALFQLSYHRQVEVSGIAPLTFRVSDGCSAD